jgi:hypothetical protein
MNHNVLRRFGASGAAQLDESSKNSARLISIYFPSAKDFTAAVFDDSFDFAQCRGLRCSASDCFDGNGTSASHVAVWTQAKQKADVIMVLVGFRTEAGPTFWSASACFPKSDLI